jgi:hypothetical protein
MPNRFCSLGLPCAATQRSIQRVVRSVASAKRAGSLQGIGRYHMYICKHTNIHVCISRVVRSVASAKRAGSLQGKAVEWGLLLRP